MIFVALRYLVVTIKQSTKASETSYAKDSEVFHQSSWPRAARKSLTASQSCLVETGTTCNGSHGGSTFSWLVWIEKRSQMYARGLFGRRVMGLYIMQHSSTAVGTRTFRMYGHVPGTRTHGYIPCTPPTTCGCTRNLGRSAHTARRSNRSIQGQDTNSYCSRYVVAVLSGNLVAGYSCWLFLLAVATPFLEPDTLVIVLQAWLILHVANHLGSLARVFQLMALSLLLLT